MSLNIKSVASALVDNFACFDLSSNSVPENLLKSLVAMYLSW